MKTPRLIFTSHEQELTFRKDETGLAFGDLRDGGWRDTYYLTDIEARQLADWIQREIPETKANR